MIYMDANMQKSQIWDPPPPPPLPPLQYMYPPSWAKINKSKKNRKKRHFFFFRRDQRAKLPSLRRCWKWSYIFAYAPYSPSYTKNRKYLNYWDSPQPLLPPELILTNIKKSKKKTFLFLFLRNQREKLLSLRICWKCLICLRTTLIAQVTLKIENICSAETHHNHHHYYHLS